jgi:hypothetical protein
MNGTGGKTQGPAQPRNDRGYDQGLAEKVVKAADSKAGIRLCAAPGRECEAAEPDISLARDRRRRVYAANAGCSSMAQ